MIPELFEAQVERAPDAIAIIHGNQRLTYRTLKQRADGLVDQLRALDLRPGQVVAFCLPRGPQAVSTMLAIMRCGCAFLPINSKLPRLRQDQVLQIAAAELLVTAEGIIRLPLSEPRPADRVVPDSAAYVLFTSGTTGVPKAVCVPHRAVVRLVCNVDYVRLDAETRFLHMAPLSFDACMLEMWGPLLNGGTLVVHPDDAPDLAGLGATIAEHGVTTAWLTASLFNHIIDIGPEILRPLRELLTGGEALSVPHVVRALTLLPGTTLINGYGPTEAATFTTTFKVPRDFDATAHRVPVGRPLPETQVYVLDEHQQLQPLGVPGEIYIGGSGVAIGYLGDQALTSAKFLPDKFSQRPGAFLYRTGDFGCLLADGNLDLLGRRDNQIKIRGFRIELGEIETALRQHAAVKETLVVAREDVPGDKRLVAYLTFKEGEPPKGSELRGLLQATLPEYMVPSAFVTLDRFPLTPNGKVDRKALPQPDRQSSPVGFVPPASATEKALANIWGEVLGIEQVGLHDNFFELGGHSLLAVRVIGRINKTLDVKLGVIDLFRIPTIEALAATIERNRKPRNRLTTDGGAKVVQLQEGTVSLPIYFIGAGPVEYRIAQSIGEHHPIFAIDIPMPVEWRHAIATADRTALPTFEQLGALYGDVLHAHAGSSPCVVAGYSFGGKVAFEAARALQRAGGNLAFVLLIDAYTWSGLTRGTGWRSLWWIWRPAATGTASDTPYINRLRAALGNSWLLLRWLLAQMPRVVKRRIRRANHSFSSMVDKDGMPVNVAVMVRLSRIIGKSYHPRPLDASGMLIRAEFSGQEMLPGLDFTNGWRDLFARGLEIVQATGGHVSMLGDENIAAWARQLNEALDRHSLSQEKRGGQRRLRALAKTYTR